MAAKRIAIEVGQVYGDWTVIGEANRELKSARFPCRCKCGNTSLVRPGNLASGASRRCFACSMRARNKSYTPEYGIWAGIIQRCCNPNSTAYANYGGRGIRVCERWMKFDAFQDDMGQRPSSEHSIDRIDVNGNYCPENCRWATSEEQCNNKRDTLRITINGETRSATQWANKTGIHPNSVYARIRRGQKPEDAVTNPVSESTLLEYRGELLTFRQISDKYGVSEITVRRRVKSGMPIDLAIETPSASNHSGRPIKLFEHNGESLSIKDWAKKTSINPITLRRRMQEGLSLKEAIEKPVRQKSR